MAATIRKVLIAKYNLQDNKRQSFISYGVIESNTNLDPTVNLELK